MSSHTSATAKHVWLPHPELVWTPALVSKNDGSYTTYDTVQGDTLTIANNVTVPNTLETVSAGSLEGNVSNLEVLDEMGEGAVIHSLRLRYGNDEIYTNIGPILVSVNPYKQLPIYSSTTICKYPPSSSTHLASVAPPHVFAIAASAYHQLRTNREDQAIIISGESGAGKTEATKTVLSYLSEVTLPSTRSKNYDDSVSTDGNGSNSSASYLSTPSQILLSNPILEAFGNAKTLRNNNSSRFGKYMQVFISLRTGSILAAKISHYLLEKSRVTHVTENERNYHIFYQMLDGLARDDKQKYQLKSIAEYNYLSQSPCVKIDGVNDRSEWQITLNAMKQLQFNDNEIDTITATLSAILQLGNLRFAEQRVNNMDGTVVVNEDELNAAATNLRVAPALLSQALRHRSVTIRGELSMIPLNLSETKDSRDALSKTLYDRLFCYIVTKLNSTLMKESEGVDLDHAKSIGILDIFGFEIFEKNLFEQFCINLANEKLQQHFNQHIFKLEKELYAAEQIASEAINFVDNLPCLQLLEGKAGIISLMNEEILLPQGNDKSLVEKMHKKFASDKVCKSPYYDVIKKNPSIFIINHYAGAVHYESDGLINKNKDRLHDILEELIQSSQLPLWRVVERAEMLRQREFEALQAEQQEKSGAKFSTRTMTQTMGGTKKIKSLGLQFSSQLNLLMDALNACQPHFIRCVKPNLVKKPNRFDSKLVLTQLSYAGLFEAIQIRKSGYSFRKDFAPFLKEFRILFQIHQLHQLAKIPSERSKVQHLMKEFLSAHLDSREWQLGRTKVFMKNSQRLILLRLKDEALSVKALILQSAFRGCLARRKVNALRSFYRECLSVLSDTATDLRSTTKRESMKSLIERAQRRNYHLYAVKQFKAMLEYYHEEERVMRVLIEALASHSLPILQDAEQSVKHLQSRCPAYINPVSSESVVSHYDRLLTEIIRLESIELELKRLRALILEENEMELQSTLASLLAMNAVESDEIVRAKQLLREFEDEAHKWAKLKLAINSKEVNGVESAVEEVRKLKRLDDTKSKLLVAARDTLLNHYTQKLQTAMASSDNITDVSAVLMPKLVQLQFVDLVYLSQAWLDQCEQQRLDTKRRESDARRIEAAAAAAPAPVPDAPVLQAPVPVPAAPSVIEDDVSKRHAAEKAKRLEQMERITARQKRASIIASIPLIAPAAITPITLSVPVAARSEDVVIVSDDTLPPPPPPPPADEYVPPPPIPDFPLSPGVVSEDADLFFPPPPPSDGDARDSQLQAALDSKDFASLTALLYSCNACGHTSRTVRLSENVLRQYKEERKVRDAIERIRDDGFGNEELMKQVIKKSQSVGLADDPEVKELRFIVYTMSALERMELRLQHAKEKGNVPLLLFLLNQANDDCMESAKIDSVRKHVQQGAFSVSISTVTSPRNNENAHVNSTTTLATGSTEKSSKLKSSNERTKSSKPTEANHTHSVSQPSSHDKYRRFLDTFRAGNSVTGLVSSTMNSLTMPLSLLSYPFLRKPASYAKHSILHKQRVERSMIKFTRDELPTSLLLLSTEHCGSKKESIRLKTLAKQIFKNVRGYCGDCYHPYPASLAYEVALMGVNELPLRDEIYCQLIKQTNENPNQSSLLLVFKLLYLCLDTFAPSHSLTPFVLSTLAIYAKTSLPSNESLHWSSVDEVAMRCWLVWQQSEREREARDRELDLRRQRGERIDANKVRELERGQIKIPSMVVIEKLTNGTLMTGSSGSDDLSEREESKHRHSQQQKHRRETSSVAVSNGKTSMSATTPLSLPRSPNDDNANTSNFSKTMVSNGNDCSINRAVTRLQVTVPQGQVTVSTSGSPRSSPPNTLVPRSPTGSGNIVSNFVPLPIPPATRTLSNEGPSAPAQSAGATVVYNYAPLSPFNSIPNSPSNGVSGNNMAVPPPLLSTTMNKALSPQSAVPFAANRMPPPLQSQSVPTSPLVAQSVQVMSPPLLSAMKTSPPPLSTVGRSPPPLLSATKSPPPLTQLASNSVPMPPIFAAPIAPIPPPMSPASSAVKNGPPTVDVKPQSISPNGCGDRDALMEALRSPASLRKVGPPAEKSVREQLGV